MGIEVFERKSIEKIERGGNQQEIIDLNKEESKRFIGKKKTKYAAFESYLQAKSQIARNLQKEGKKEYKIAEVLLTDIMDAYKKLFKTKDIIIERIGFVRDGHSYNIYKGFDNDFRVWIYGDESPVIIEKDKINFLLQIILNLEQNQHYGARYFFTKIIEHYNLQVGEDAFSGGRNRAKFYFVYYLIPMKIIEKETDLIKVTIGRGGGIIKLR